LTGEEMERAIEFLLQNQAALGERVTELSRIMQVQAESQGQLNQTLTTAITTLAEAQTKTEAKVDRLTVVVEKLVERLSP
jgi:hypothetical protein